MLERAQSSFVFAMSVAFQALLNELNGPTPSAPNYPALNVAASNKPYHLKPKRSFWPVVAGIVAVLSAGVLLNLWPAKVVTNEAVLDRLIKSEAAVAAMGTALTAMQLTVEANSGRQDRVGNIVSDTVRQIDGKIGTGLDYVLAIVGANQTAYELHAEQQAGERENQRELIVKERLDAINGSAVALEALYSTYSTLVHGLSWKLTKTEAVVLEQFHTRLNASLDHVRRENARLSLETSMSVSRLRNNLTEVETVVKAVAEKLDDVEIRVGMIDEKVVNTTDTVHALGNKTKQLAEPMAEMFGSYLWTFVVFVTTLLVVCLSCWFLIYLHMDASVETLAEKHFILLAASHAALAAPKNGARRPNRNAAAGVANNPGPPAVPVSDWTKVWTTLLIQASPLIVCIIAFVVVVYVMTHPFMIVMNIAGY